jgi:hypothetical protein
MEEAINDVDGALDDGAATNTVKNITTAETNPTATAVNNPAAVNNTAVQSRGETLTTKDGAPVVGAVIKPINHATNIDTATNADNAVANPTPPHKQGDFNTPQKRNHTSANQMSTSDENTQTVSETEKSNMIIKQYARLT